MGRGGELSRKCWREMKERVAKGKEISGWEEEKRTFFESKEVRLDEVVEEGKEAGEWFAGLERKDVEDQKRERWRKINESRYNRW